MPHTALNLTPDISPNGLEMLQRAMEHAVEGASKLDAEGRYTYVNDRYAAIAGRKPEALIGEPWTITVHPTELPRLEAAYREMIETGKVVCEARGQRPDGRVFFKRVTMIAEYAPDGALTGHYCFAQDITQQTAALEEHRRWGEWLGLTESIGKIGHWFLDLTEDTVYWSDEVYAIHGRERASYTPILGTAIEAYHPDDQDYVAACVQAAIDDREPFNFERRIVRPTGEVRWVWSRGECRTGPDGEPAAIFGLFRDITEERTAQIFRETALKILAEPADSAEDRVLAMLNAATDHFKADLGFLYLEPEDHAPVFVPTNTSSEWQLDDARGLTELLKFKDINAERIVTATANDDTPFGEIVAALGLSALVAAPLHFNGKSAGLVGFHASAVRTQPFSRQDGEIAELMATWCTQEMQRQFAADELQISQERFGLAVAGSGVGISDWRDLTQDEVYWSDQYYKLLGYEPGEVPALTSGFIARLHPDDRNRVVDAIRRHMKTGLSYVEEARLKTKDGSYRWFMGTGQAVWAADGTPVRMIGSILDIDERKRAEAERAEFVSTVSHELRTPLTALMGVIGLVQTGSYGSLNEKGEHLLGVARSSGDRMVRLINDLLDIEKMDSGSFQMSASRQSLWPLVERAVEENCTALKQAGMTIELHNEAGDTEIVLDTDRFLQVLSNLLSNAGKFTPADGCISLSAHRVGDDVRLSIKDTGPGIPEEQLQRIFARFTQVDSSVTRAVGGTGLGLAITKAIITAHGGQISARNRAQIGACFDIHLPIATSEADEASDA